MQVEIFSDVVCPWCYIGKRRFEQALADFPHRDEVEVTWRAFELDPTAPVGGGSPVIDSLAEKYGVSVEQIRASQANITEIAASVGLEYHLEGFGPRQHVARPTSCCTSRMTAVSRTPSRSDCFVPTSPRARHRSTPRRWYVLQPTLASIPRRRQRLLPTGRTPRQSPTTSKLARSFGIRGVPFFVIDRAFAVEGAQPADLIREALDRAWTASRPLTMVTSPESADDAQCLDDTCAV